MLIKYLPTYNGDYSKLYATYTKKEKALENEHIGIFYNINYSYT